MFSGRARITREKMSKDTTESKWGGGTGRDGEHRIEEYRKKERHKETKEVEERHGGPSILRTVPKKSIIIKSVGLGGSLRRRTGKQNRA